MDPACHYLDFAATSALRPPEVVEAVTTYLIGCGATPGRGGYGRALEAGRLVYRARRAVQEVLGLADVPGEVVFGAHATQALNTALRGVLEAGDVVVVTDFDHNAVLRPVHALSNERGVVVRRVPGRLDGTLDLEALDRALDGARLLTVNAASNVLGTRLDVPALVRRARDAGAVSLVDTAQTAGHVETDLTGADLVAVTGHKGLLAPQGIGALWVREGIEVRPLLHGGTGGNSLDPEMPALLPDRLEAGTLNGPGIAGLLAGCHWIMAQGVGTLHARSARLRLRLHDGLAGLAGVRVVSPRDRAGIAIVTMVADRHDPASLAHGLDRTFGVQARAGLHCAPHVHRLLGTETSGALRFSPGWCTTEADIDRAVEGVARLTGSLDGSDP